ncbi:hypothetical protein PIB30_001365 [Stylosanthes scabra]|uniref:F-box associated beta-propeller type 1 domain-containing protein n=1 Tax=Stylosanthes scabra TaxID=79078 RepID=A0ABU6Y1P3_9FABA|nr:hypothetical protein [Stylosanthes scabra]
MNDLTHIKLPPPTLPDDVIHEIIKKGDPETVQQWKSEKLTRVDFCAEMYAKWKGRGQYLIAHLGYIGFKPRMDWIVRLNVVTGDLEELRLPFDVQPGGWFGIVGVQNGNMCLRLSSTGRRSQLIVWNPATKIHRYIEDPTQHYCTMCSFIYSFVYYPNSQKYAIVHLYRKSLRDELCWLTMFSLETPHWEYNILCPPYVQKLDGHTVSLDGVCYWVSWARDIVQYPAYILGFSIVTKSSLTITIPPKAYSNDHRLIIYDGYLCMVSISRDEINFESTLWKIKQNGSEVSWECVFTIRGEGFPEIPTI